MDEKQKMTLEDFLGLDTFLETKSASDFEKQLKINETEITTFRTKIFQLDNEKLLKLLNLGVHDYASSLRMPIHKAQQYYFDDEFLKDLFEVLSKVEVCVGFVDKGWRSVCYSEYIGNKQIIPLLIREAKEKDQTFCFIIMLNKVEFGGFLAAGAGFGETYKEAKEDVEIRVIHSFGLTK